MQDITGIGNEGRMNKPATTGQNWNWRMSKKDLKKTTICQKRTRKIRLKK